jgi:hypothetical protein
MDHGKTVSAVGFLNYCAATPSRDIMGVLAMGGIKIMSATR